MAEEAPRTPADLSTLDGIGKARQSMYTKLEGGEITEARAMAMERVLRGQSELKGSIPLRLVNIIAKARNPRVQLYAEPLMERLLGFVAGEEAVTAMKALDKK